MKKINKDRNLRIRKKVRRKIIGSGRKRVSVFRSNKYIYAQVIDDVKDITLAVSSSKNLKVDAKITKKEQAKMVGTDLAKKIVKLKIKEVVFDRGSYRYLGRVKELAIGLREGGIII